MDTKTTAREKRPGPGHHKVEDLGTFQPVPIADIKPPSGTTTRSQPISNDVAGLEKPWKRAMKRVRTKLGEEVYSSWFAQMKLEARQDEVLHVSQATRFLKSWIERNYMDELVACCGAEIEGVSRIKIEVRRPGYPAQGAGERTQDKAIPHSGETGIGLPETTEGGAHTQTPVFVDPATQTEVAGFQGSPLDPRLTFDSFVTGASNRLAYAAAKQVAESLMDRPLRYNPLYMHANVGLGKTHLQHAIAWEVKRRFPSARVLYLTAERFRYRFVEAIRSQRAMPFKEAIRNIDILLIDDMEFLQGERTEQEFDHTLNALLDSGRQVVVASANAPSQLEGLDPRMRSRLAGGLVTELGALDYDLRRHILERRAQEKQAADPTFQLPREVIDFLADKLNESARELDGAITRLYAACHLTGTPITIASAEHIIRDLMRGMEPKRIKIDDILKLVSKHYGVSRNDILSQRRHRSVVRPRQIAMYLAKQLTSRSLPEIGRRIGGRDHTTVLHAVRKIGGELDKDLRLKDEIDELKRFLSV